MQISRSWYVVTLAAAVVTFLLPRTLTRPAGRQTFEERVLTCRVMEAHTDAALRMIVVVFHQRDRQDQAALGNLLRQHSGDVLEINTPTGDWKKVTIWRLRSCFGRGMFVAPSAVISLKDGEEFALRFPSR